MTGRTWMIAAACAVTILVTGCTSSSVITSEQVPKEGDKGVTIRLQDGRTLRLEKGDYTVADDSARTISGHGRIRGTDAVNDLGAAWEGSIPSSQVAWVRIEEYSTFGKVSIATVATLVVTFVGLLVLLANSSFPVD